MTRTRRAFTRSELIVCLGVAMVLIAISLPLIGAGRSRSRELVSLSNLKTLAVSHAAYAADWGGRQFTNMPDNMAQSGGLFGPYLQMFQTCPPSIILGFGGTYPPTSQIGEWAYWMTCENSSAPAGNFALLWPMQFGAVGAAGAEGLGMWRFQNVIGFNEYVNGPFMDPVFYAPADAQAMSAVGPGLENPNPFTWLNVDSDSAWSSYVSSPSAMFHPGVFGGDDGDFKSPYTFTSASISPTVDQCTYPDLKGRLIEHRWLQAPAYELPFIGFPEKAFFNLGADSEPMTLFFDGHTTGLSVRKVLADNQSVVKGGGAKLWMDTEITVGPWSGYEGFYSAFAVDDTRTSFHVFTRFGILGRDCVTSP